MSRTPKLGAGPRTSTSASMRTSPRNAPIHQATPKGNSTLSLNTTIDRLGLGRPVFSGSLDVSLLEMKSPSASDSRAWQSPKSTIYFADLLSGSGVEDALEEAERLRQQNIIIKSQEKRLLWSERRDIKRKSQLDESVEMTRAIVERRNLSNRSRAEAEKVTKREKEEAAAWRLAKLMDEKRVREAKLMELKAREKDDLDRSVEAMQTSNIQWVRESRSKEEMERKQKEAEARRDRLETIRLLREQRADAAKLEQSSLLSDYHAAVTVKLRRIISETQTSAQSLLSTSQKV